MYERKINNYIFKWDGEGMVSVLKYGKVIHRFPLPNIKSQKEFDSEISFWFFQNANILESA